MTTKHERETVIEAVRGTGRWQSPDPAKDGSSFGNVTAIAKRLGVERQTVYGYMERWASVRQAVEDEREKRKDFVEDRMMKRIMEGSDTMIIFFAKTQMKDRGFVERQELTGADGGPLLVVSWDDATDDTD
jgi:hypothetical protein